MKYLPAFLSLSLLCTSFASVCHAQSGDSFNPLGRDIPIDEMEKQLRIQVEWIELAHEDMTALLEEEDPLEPKHYRSSNDAPLRMALRELIAEKKANVVETAVVIARSGQRAKTESVHEQIYATEYDPPMLSTKESESASTASLPTGAAFETRNLGTTLEVDPVLGADGLTIDLNLAPEIVYPAGESHFGHYQSGDSELDMTMPTFYTLRLSSTVTLIAGEYLLLGTHSPVSSETNLPDFDRKVMVFVKVDVLVTGLRLEEKKEAVKSKKPAKAEQGR